MVSGNYFRVLGVEPRLGRGFRRLTKIRRPAAMPWSCSGRTSGRANSRATLRVVGRTVRLNGTDFTVIGVAPDSFPGMQIFAHPDFYMPLAMAQVFSTNPRKDFFEDRDDRELSVKARLKPGATLRRGAERAGAARQRLRTRVSGAQSRSRRGGAHAVRDADARRYDGDPWKFGVIFTILALARAAGGVHQCRGTSLEPRPHANPRDRRAAGDRRRAFPADPAAADGEPDPSRAWADWAGSPSGTAASVSPGRSRFRPSCRQVSRSGWMRGCLLACLALSLLSALLCGLAPALQSTQRGPGERAQGGRRGRARTQAPVGPERAGGGADLHLADAADGRLSDGPGLHQEPGRGNPVPEGSIC